MLKLKTPKGLPVGRQGAISILLTILILSVVLVIAFGISSVLLRQIKMSGQTSDSVRAYQAADSGIEYALNQVKGGSPIPDGKICDNWTPVDSGSFCLEITAGTPAAPEGIKSIGQAGQTQRAVEVAMAQALEVPAGVIVMWSGTIDTIPDGWALCDGTNGTPDLTDRFICGVSSGENPGATGGANTYILTVDQLPSHNHDVTINDPGHEHRVWYTSSFQNFPVGYAIEAATDLGHKFTSNRDWQVITQAKTTGITATSLSVGSNSAINNQPAYYKLAYIMKL